MSTIKIFPSLINICKRGISTTSPVYGKRNFRKFLLYNKRGSRIFKKQQIENPDPDVPIDKRGVKDTGYTINGKYVEIPELIPELIVPDLTDFKLKPYVSYKTPEVYQTKFTSKDLFDAVYSKKIIEDFKAGKLDENGNPLEPSIEEKLTPEEAKINARKTGSDIF
ncbi:39S ribosomal protein L41, mitochondrial [Ctenocephalides felis]|uniref:39S ribosomal protein L41, mitochondrial n=1 Tax=Ctenocephalides felis TaxID=7515 RepID=UPI000E6E40C1|nr:39S ribosomal protein L41, mitochondrial [Ctenocephalides felis]